MPYFTNLPTIFYPFQINGKQEIKVIRDITRNVRVIKDIASSITLFELYDVVDGETPEIISERFYGTVDYHWVLMLINERWDYVSDFPLTQPNLDKFVTQKYGAGNENAVHHWIGLDGFITSSDQSGATSISNAQYEATVNESKRTMKIVTPEVMALLQEQFLQII